MLRKAQSWNLFDIPCTHFKRFKLTAMRCKKELTLLVFYLVCQSYKMDCVGLRFNIV